jgi:SNF2 family DNA or RNA helicase
MLWLDMGLGKTSITLTSVAHLIATGFLTGVVIVAPIRVIRLVWRQEALKWTHTKHLTFSLLTGTKDQRTRALLRPANIYLVNYENLGWLAETLATYFISKNRPLPFDGLVWDEISKCKNSNTQRVKATKKILPHFVWTTGLTGTPASNGYKDLHGQYLVVDKGLRLGTSKTAFRQRFYRKEGPHREVPFDGAEDEIKQLIGDITLEMSAADYNPLPDMIVNDVEIELPENLRALYNRMEKELFIQLDSGKEVEMFNQAALTNKCLQFSNGAMYPVAGMPLWEPIHDLKLEALEEIIDEAQGQQVLCAYAYRSDAERIMERFKALRPVNLTECKSEAALQNAMSRWASGDCLLLIGHPASMGHGIDGLQKRGHIIVWYGLNWSLDLYDQMNARIRRQGQGAPVICHRLMVLETLDQAQAMALDEKAQTQAGLRNAVKQYRLTRGI